MKKLCKAHHLKHEHKMCKAHSPDICEMHKSMKKSEDTSSPCPYCAEIDSDHSNCQYCDAYDAEKGDDHSDCAMCQEYDAKKEAGYENSCPYCAEIDQEQASGHECNCPNCAKSAPDQQGLQSEDI